MLCDLLLKKLVMIFFFFCKCKTHFILITVLVYCVVMQIFLKTLFIFVLMCFRVFLKSVIIFQTYVMFILKLTNLHNVKYGKCNLKCWLDTVN